MNTLIVYSLHRSPLGLSSALKANAKIFKDTFEWKKKQRQNGNERKGSETTHLHNKCLYCIGYEAKSSYQKASYKRQSWEHTKISNIKTVKKGKVFSKRQRRAQF